MQKLQKDTKEKVSQPLNNKQEESNFSTLTINDLSENIKAIYDRFKSLRDIILNENKIAPYIEHQYAYMTKAFSLFVDYFNQYNYSLPFAVKKAEEDLKALDDDETTQTSSQSEDLPL